MIKFFNTTIAILLLLLFNTSFAQKAKPTKRFEDEYNTWSLGAGFSILNLHGDLRSFDTYSGEPYYNFGGYVYGQRMFNPILGAEFKFNLSQIGGEVQRLYTSGDPFTQIYYSILYADNYTNEVLYVDGLTFGLEGNMVVNLTNLWRRVPRKWSASFYLGAGFQRYNSRLIIKNFKGYTNEEGYTPDKLTPEGVIKDADFGYNHSRDNKTNAGALYVNLGLGVKRKLSPRFELEGRLNIGVNNEDHFDAAISQKQVYESFITTSLGVVYNFGSKKEAAIWAVDDNASSFSSNDLKIALVDTDKDGVADMFDQEMNTPQNAEVYGSGIAIDTDKDGIQDYRDKCPLEPGPPERQGCPLEEVVTPVVVQAVDTVPAVVEFNEDDKKDIVEQISLLSKSIYFKSASDQLKKESYKPLNDISNIMVEYPESKYKIEGHTDSQGKDSYNLSLSDRRAKSVEKYLLSKNIASDRLSSKGYGETKPIASNATAEGRQMNRRVEINFIDPNSAEGKLVYEQGVTFTRKPGVNGAMVATGVGAASMLQSDSDGDGVPDYYDKEPNTPKESRVYGDGVSVDSDMDNVPDYRDKCPFRRGSVDNQGCPKGTPINATSDCVEGVDCAEKEADKSAVLDSLYKQESQVSTAVIGAKASGVSQKDKRTAIIRMFNKIKFSRSESNKLKDSNIEIVHLAAEMMLDYGEGTKFRIEIHTDDKPNKIYNKEISKRRAFAIKQQLLKNGLKKEQFEVIGMGADKMKFNRDIREENVKNNRIEVIFK